MLENARRQVILVLLTIVGALLCSYLMTPGFGMDLKGGNQLIYEVPEEVLAKLVKADANTSIDAVMDHTVRIVRDRIDPTGVLDALVSRRGQNGILIELPYREKSELDVIKARITSLGKLEMRIVAYQGWTQGELAFDLPAEKRRLEDWLKTGGKELVLEDYRNIDRFNDSPNTGPVAFGKVQWVPHLVEPQLENKKLWSLPMSMGQSSDGVQPLAESVVAVFDQAADFNGGMLPEARSKQERPFLLEYLAINTAERHFRGEDLDPSGVGETRSPDGRPAVHYKIRDELSGKYADWSGQYKKKHSAIILNGVVRSAPYFVGRIPGVGQISGSFTSAEVNDLVKVLRTGSLQVEPQMLSDSSVGPTLGARALRLGEISLIAGTLAVFAFMLWYYKLAGVVACITLLLNVLLLWAAVLFMQATITLPGLGGIVLTMGMAVDANVLIYERIREEADRGKDMLRAVRAGFERAMSAILDSNITTFLTGLVLYNVGVGPVRGFAVTLMVGIVTTVFTQFFVTRLLFHFLLVKEKLKDFKVRRLLAQPTFDYLRHGRTAVTGSVIVIALGLIYAIAFVPSEVSQGIDFKGGANLQMLVKQPTEVESIANKLAADADFQRDFRNATVNTIEQGADGKASSFNVRLKLTDTMRAQIELDRTAWREQRRAAADAGNEPPAPYVAPYIAHMRRIFADDLVQSAYSDPDVIPGTNNDAFAQITLHFQRPVEVLKLQQLLAKVKVPLARASILGNTAATQSQDLFVEWTTGPKTTKTQLFDYIREALAKAKTEDALKDIDGNPVRLSDPFPEAQEIQGRMVGELRNAAIGALILSWGLIIFYLRVRFHEYKYGIAAVAALVHDVLVAFVVVVAFNYFGWVHAEINLNMIACFLTIIGYSVNDTIVIFDRIRENLAEEQKLGGHLSLPKLINLSVNQTMSRTILTTGVTLFVVLAQFLVNWGTGSDLESFSFAMFVGMISGTYSTIFIAAPVLTWIANRYPSTFAAPTPAPAEVVAE